MDASALPRHPRTGLYAVGIVAGKPVWPIMGASSEHDGDGEDRDGAAEDENDDGENDDAAGQDPDDGFDALPEKTKAELRRLRRLDQDHRATNKRTAKERDDARALADRITKAVKGDDGDADPDELTRLLSEKDERIRQLDTERAADKAIRTHKGDHETLLDSRSFTDALYKLDPADDDFTAALDALVKDTVASSDRYKAAQTRTRNGSGSGEHGGTGPQGRPKDLRDAYARRRTS